MKQSCLQCPECKKQGIYSVNIVRLYSLSTAEPDVIAILTQCSRNSAHIHAFYYRLERIEKRLREDLIKIE